MIYDEFNQLEDHIQGTTVQWSRYDADGFRVHYGTGVGGPNTLVLMDGPNVMGEWASTSGLPQGQFSKLYLADGLSMFSELTGNFKAANRSDYVVDFLGSVRGWTPGDNGASLQESTTYKPFGGVLSGGISLSYGWTGNTGSRQTGLTFAEQYNRARFYSKKTYQWISVDPLWPGEVEYGYVGGNPISLLDASGTRQLPPTNLTGSLCGVTLGAPERNPCKIRSFFGACMAMACAGLSAAQLISAIKNITMLGKPAEWSGADFAKFLKEIKSVKAGPFKEAEQCCEDASKLICPSCGGYSGDNIVWSLLNRRPPPIVGLPALFALMACRGFSNGNWAGAVCKNVHPDDAVECKKCCEELNLEHPDGGYCVTRCTRR